MVPPGRGGGLAALEDEMGGYIGRGLLLLILGEEKGEAGFAGVVVVVMGLGEGGRGRGWSISLKEGEKEEEVESWMGREKEKEMSLSSFSWTQKAQMALGLFRKG